MHAATSFFEQAADKLREAMEGAVTGVDRARLIQEALDLYHRHKLAVEVRQSERPQLAVAAGGDEA